MSRKHSVPRRRRNLLAAGPYCHWCGREVREYPRFFAKGEPVPDDMATVDHLSQKAGNGEKRPEKGSTVLACHPCNRDRGKQAREILPCAECGGESAKGRFCSRECFIVNRERLLAHQRPWEENRREVMLSRRKEKERRRKRRQRLRKQGMRAMPIDVFYADKTELGWRAAVSLFLENRKPGKSPCGPAYAIAYMRQIREGRE